MACDELWTGLSSYPVLSTPPSPQSPRLAEAPFGPFGNTHLLSWTTWPEAETDPDWYEGPTSGLPVHFCFWWAYLYKPVLGASSLSGLVLGSRLNVIQRWS